MSRSRLAAAVLGGYVLISFLVGNAYPFSVFDMYSRVTESGSRVLARQDGRVQEIDGFVDWSCDRADLDRSCGGDGAIATSEPVERETLGWVRAHPGVSPNAIDVELVRRGWYFSGGPTRVEDCLLARCRAVPLRR